MVRGVSNLRFAVLAVDLPAFAKHAKRSTIQVEDVLLTARASPKILERLNDFVEAHDLRQPVKKKRLKTAKPQPAEKVDDDDDDDVFDALYEKENKPR